MLYKCVATGDSICKREGGVFNTFEKFTEYLTINDDGMAFFLYVILGYT